MRDIDKSKKQLIRELEVIRKRVAELESLRTHEKRHNQFLRSLHEGIWVLDKNDCTAFVNPRMAEMLGYTEDEMLGKPVFSFMDEEGVKLATVHMERRKNGIREQLDFEFICKDGGRIHTLLETSPILDDDGNYVGSIAGVQDITERRHMEEARAEQVATLARAKELQRSRQRIVSAQESLRRDIAQQIHGAVQNRLVILMHQLQELQQAVRSEELSEQLEKVRQDITELLDNQLRPIAYQLYPSILRRGLMVALQSLRDRLEISIIIEMDLDDDLSLKERHNRNFIPEPVRLAVYRITEEAIGNVIKHAGADKVVISLKSISDRLLSLKILDNGRGFHTERISCGLGIAFMQDYAELVGGECIISSISGKGTEITATFPLLRTGEEPPERVLPLE